MARITPSQLKSKLQQNQSKLKQAVRNYNTAVDKYNRDRKAAINKVNQSINRYNQAVRTHNAQVARNRTIINNELRRLQSSANRPATTQYRITYRASTLQLNNSYETAISLGDQMASLTPQQERIYDLTRE